MTHIPRLLSRDRRGQDLIEYTLLLAFIAPVSAAIYVGAFSSASEVWSAANSTLNQACA